MKSKYDPQIHYRRSIRLKEYDYTSAGGYFITIVTHHRECLFGEIVNGQMQLSDYGIIADEYWRDIPNHFSNDELGAYIVMPNHVHGIILIHDGRDMRSHVPTETFGKPASGSLGTIVRQYKSSVTRTIIKRGGESTIWQRNYYEHIIRNDDDHARIHNYIESNPSMWADDEENPAKINR